MNGNLISWRDVEKMEMSGIKVAVGMIKELQQFPFGEWITNEGVFVFYCLLDADIK